MPSRGAACRAIALHPPIRQLKNIFWTSWTNRGWCDFSQFLTMVHEGEGPGSRGQRPPSDSCVRSLATSGWDTAGDDALARPLSMSSML